MPIYEYRCLACDHRFSRLQPVGASTDGVRCPSCDRASVERLLSAFASAGAPGAQGGSPSGSSCGPFT